MLDFLWATRTRWRGSMLRCGLSDYFPLSLALPHAAGVNSLIWEILAVGKRVNKTFR